MDDDTDPYFATLNLINPQQLPKQPSTDNPTTNPLNPTIPTTTNPTLQEPPESLMPQKTIQNIDKKITKDQYEYGYTIILNNNDDDGLMESFLKEPITEEKPTAVPSDYFNFGLDEDKWRKLINHSILMHYEKHIRDQKLKQDIINDNNNVNTSIPLSQQKPPQLQPNQQLQQPPVNIMTANPLPGINLIQPLPNMMNQGISAIPFHTLNPAVNTLPQNQMNYAMNMNLNMQRFYYK